MQYLMNGQNGAIGKHLYKYNCNRNTMSGMVSTKSATPESPPTAQLQSPESSPVLAPSPLEGSVEPLTFEEHQPDVVGDNSSSQSAYPEVTPLVPSPRLNTSSTQSRKRSEMSSAPSEDPKAKGAKVVRIEVKSSAPSKTPGTQRARSINKVSSLFFPEETAWIRSRPDYLALQRGKGDTGPRTSKTKIYKDIANDFNRKFVKEVPISERQIKNKISRMNRDIEESATAGLADPGNTPIVIEDGAQDEGQGREEDDEGEDDEREDGEGEDDKGEDGEGEDDEEEEEETLERRPRPQEQRTGRRSQPEAYPAQQHQWHRQPLSTNTSKRPTQPLDGLQDTNNKTASRLEPGPETKRMRYEDTVDKTFPLQKLEMELATHERIAKMEAKTKAEMEVEKLRMQLEYKVRLKELQNERLRIQAGSSISPTN
ncbi:hypothetical protein BGZ58_000200 [Dissophora ornata]|nr:hypothetical protein BGZ58_000200 [Dissophora ornata]